MPHRPAGSRRIRALPRRGIRRSSESETATRIRQRRGKPTLPGAPPLVFLRRRSARYYRRPRRRVSGRKDPDPAPEPPSRAVRGRSRRPDRQRPADDRHPSPGPSLMPSVTYRAASLLPPLALPLVLVAQPARESPVPRTSSDGPALVLDWPALHVGVAEYDEGPTGATVFYFPERAVGAVDVRGGAPGTVNTDALRQGYESRVLHAVVFAGGSWHGLAAANAVADEVRASR